MSSFEAQICQASSDNAIILSVSAAALILICLIMVLAGFKLIRPFAFILGSVLGLTVSYFVIETYISASLNFWWKIGISISVGLLVGGLCACLVFISVALLGFALGVFICSLILATPLGPTLFTQASWAPLVTFGLCGLAGSLLTLLFQTAIVIVACSLSGSMGIAFAVDCAWVHSNFVDLIPNIISMHTLPDFENATTLYLFLGGIGAGTLLGCIVQGILHHRKKKRRDIDDSDL